jgi:Transposase DDE domain
MAKNSRPLKPRRRVTGSKQSGQFAHAGLEELPIWPEPVKHGALVKDLQRYVEQLRGEDAHGNQKLFLDDVFIVYLLSFFNPTIRTLRTVEDFSQTKQAQKHLSIPKICRSTLSDFNHLADPTRLGPILEALKAELARKAVGGRLPEDLVALHKQIRAIDGTFLPAAADVAWAVVSRNQRDGELHRARLDWHVDVATWLPELVVAPEVAESEADSAARHVASGTIGIYDRAYGSFDLIAAHYDRNDDGKAIAPRAEFVIRLKEPGPNSPTFAASEVRPLDAEAIAANVVSDRLGNLPGLEARHKLGATLREVVVIAPDGKEVRLLTNLLGVSAHVIAILYYYRWQIELFFRWLKCFAHFNHLISHSRAGVLLNFYVVIIGVTLLYLHTGYRPSKYALALLGLAAQGATLAEILPILRERERQCESDRQSAARRRARRKDESQ